ncbi:unnamed protein product, partial [Symbiodinium sp. CCMP2456]
MTSRQECTLKAIVASFPPPNEGFEGPSSMPDPVLVHQAASWGSLGHPVLCHRPCVYLLKGSACRQGVSCQFCHHSQHSPIPKLDQEQRARVQGLSEGDLVSLLIPHIREQAEAAGLLEQVGDFICMLDKKFSADREHKNDNIRMKIPRKELYRLKKNFGSQLQGSGLSCELENSLADACHDLGEIAAQPAVMVGRGGCLASVVLGASLFGTGADDSHCAMQLAPGSSRRGQDEKFGFYFPVYTQLPGTLRVLQSVRRFYPDSPIYVFQDGGKYDFGPLCRAKPYNCIFARGREENSRWNPHSWMARFRNATKVLGTEYVIYLEPDVIVRKHHVLEPTHDAGGMYDDYNPSTHKETLEYLGRMGRERDPNFNVSWPHFGLAGGSYFKAEAILDAFDPKWLRRIDWEGMKGREGDKVMSSDFAMLVALSARGWTVYPWEESSQYPGPQSTAWERRKSFNADAAFEHNHKEHYHDMLPEFERRLITTFADMPQVCDGCGSCHGCVWYVDADPSRPLPIPSRQPPVP